MLICSADGNAQVCPFIVNRCEKLHCLRIWRIIHVIQNHTKMYGGLEDCFLSCWSLFKRNLALLMDMCAAHSDVGITLQSVHASSTCCQTPPVHATTVTKYHLPYETRILQACSTLFVVRSRQEFSHGRHKVECCECHTRCSHGMEIRHAHSNSELFARHIPSVL